MIVIETHCGQCKKQLTGNDIESVPDEKPCKHCGSTLKEKRPHHYQHPGIPMFGV